MATRDPVPSDPPRGERSLRFEREVAALPDHVYAVWEDSEALPEISDAIRRVKRIDDRRELWEVDLAGRHLMWEARILERARGERLRWQTVHGPPSRGEVRFEPSRQTPGHTRLVLEMRYQPRGWIERLGAALGVVERQVRLEMAHICARAEIAALAPPRAPHCAA